MHRTTLSLTAACLLVHFAGLTAQVPPTIEPGERVRVTAPALGISQYTGLLTAVDNDTLVVDELRITLPSVTRLEVSRGHKSAAGWGLVIGSLVGVAVGSAGEPKACDETGPAAWDGIGDCISDGLGQAFLYAAVGAALGVVIGSMIKSDRWDEIPVERLRVNVAARLEGRFALGLVVSF